MSDNLSSDTRTWQAIAALNGFIALAMGAASAHAFADPHTATLVWKASLYELIHAAVLLWLAGVRGTFARAARWLFLAGIAFFCGALYAKALTEWGGIVMLSPIGGFSLMAGWLTLALKAWRD
ncbi:MAG TPA: DUF423 domain-containing protein [Alphaproteobacteria bacterium]|nr:DUF423 domain-containing protein [Alphaproteobacteria bacterium]